MPRPPLPTVGADIGAWGTKNNALWNDAHASLDRFDSVRVDVRQHGAVGDGVTDDTAAISAAITAADTAKLPVLFMAGTYLVTGTLPNVQSWSLIGRRSSRGANALGAEPRYATTIIKFQPASNATPLVQCYRTSNPGGYIGPYYHENLTFDLGTANGFRFGLEDLDGDGVSDVVQDGPGQAYVFGVTFEQCAISGAQADRVSSASGVMTRTGRILLHLTKCFESGLRDTSLFGGDTQVRTWGCDKPVFRGVRSQGSHLPFDFHSSGTFSVQHTLEDVQVEGWTFTPIWSGAELAATNIRLEQNDATPPGSGRLALTPTASVTAGSGTLTFSTTMTNILFPSLSIIEVSNGSETFSALVTAVSTTTVTIDTEHLIVPFTAAAATVVRIHGYGPVHTSNYGASIANVSADASANCPAFVYCVGRGSMAVVNAQAEYGVHGDLNALIIGNRLDGSFHLNSMLSMVGCSPQILPDPGHPFAAIEPWRSRHGEMIVAGDRRAALGGIDSDRAQARRVWAYTPKSWSTTTANAHTTFPIVRVAGDADTSQSYWCWRFTNGAVQLALFDPTLPSVTANFIRVRIRVRTVAASGTITYHFEGSGGSGGTSFTATNTWTVYEAIHPMPAEWVGARIYGASLAINGSSASCYIAGVEIQELVAGEDIMAANPNTSGATLAALETEVNELKAALRSLGLVAG